MFDMTRKAWESESEVSFLLIVLPLKVYSFQLLPNSRDESSPLYSKLADSFDNSNV